MSITILFDSFLFKIKLLGILEIHFLFANIHFLFVACFYIFFELRMNFLWINYNHLNIFFDFILFSVRCFLIFWHMGFMNFSFTKNLIIFVNWYFNFLGNYLWLNVLSYLLSFWEKDLCLSFWFSNYWVNYRRKYY